MALALVAVCTAVKNLLAWAEVGKTVSSLTCLHLGPRLLVWASLTPCLATSSSTSCSRDTSSS